MAMKKASGGDSPLRQGARKDGLSKEIENHEQEHQEHGFELWSEDISGERE
jgi:hypothetical protein